MEVEEEEIICLSLHSHHQNDSCRFNVSLIVRDSHKTVTTNHHLFEEKGEPE